MEEEIIVNSENSSERVTKESKLKNIFDTYKKHSQIIILLPAILGGLWQILELSKISTSYIRFFSVTQMIPDGILILFFFGMLFLTSRGIIFINDISLKKNKNNEVKSIKDIRISKIIFLVIAIIYFFNYGFNLDFKQIELAPIIIHLLVFTIFVIEIFSICKDFYKIISQNYPEKINYFRKKTKGVFESIVLPAIILVSIRFFFLFLSLFSNSYILPENFKNLNDTKSKLKSIFSNNSSEILYLNDKFVFVEITDTNQQKEVIVYKFDDFIFPTK